jgi:membrane fusion protein (multidrug efflux system)
MHSLNRRAASLFGLSFAGLALAGCGDGKQNAPQASAPPPAVTVVKVVSADVKPTASFTGRVEAMFKVDLRARVDGFLEKRLFKEGADVKEGELLFVIEKGLYQAAVDQAKAGIATADATLKLADIEVGRQSELLQKNVGTQAKLDQVTATQGEARGNMLAQKATLEKAQLQLGYTDIAAPIAGRIGRSNLSVGYFVGPNSGTLATIVSQDPIYVSFPVSQREIMAVRKDQGTTKANEFLIYLQLADGSRYASPGELNFLDVTVNQGTDTVQVRATFPNPNRILVDGQLVNVVAELGKGQSLLQVPQQALQLDQTGVFVLVVDKDNKVQVRRVETGQSVGTAISVLKGLNAGDLVISEGIQKVRPGQVVQATEAKAGI